MKDKYLRNINYLRISITDRCNLRCTYCMPANGIIPIEYNELLTYEEIYKIVSIMAKNGLKYVRITGGEPTVRKNLHTLIKLISSISEIKGIGLTTNGVLLSKQLPILIENGLTALNISLDTLDPKKFNEITRRNLLSKVIDGINTAISYSNKITVKINTVITEKNKNELIKIASLAKDNNISVRFIEMMPIGLGGKCDSEHTEDNIKTYLEQYFGPMIPIKNKITSFGPSTYSTFENFKGNIGFISAISHKFCSTCNRVRLTSTGFLKTCLQFKDGCDLKSLLRNNATDDQIEKAILEAIALKPKEHHFTSIKMENDESKNMNQIGG